MRLLVFFLYLFVLVLPLQAAEVAVQAYDLRAKPGGASLRLHLTDMVDSRSFTLEHPARVVVDLPGTKWRVPKNAKAKEDIGPVKKLRAGYPEQGRLRVVLDLARPVVIEDSYLQVPEKKGEPHYLIVQLKDVAATPLATAAPKPTPTNTAAQKPAPAPVATPSASAPPGKRNFAKPQPKTPPAAPLVSAPVAVPVATPIAPPVSGAPIPKARPERFTIVIDPGHGGVDPGAIGAGGAKEKEITLRYARHLRDQLRATGRYEVVLTRSEDRYLGLRERLKKAQAANGHLFLSLHADSHPEPNMRGLSVYTLSETASDKEAQALAERENQKDIIRGVDLSKQPKEVAEVLIDLAQRDTNNTSARFAELVVSELGAEAKLLNNTHRFAGFAVLKGVGVPSVLVEMGYLSNPQEEALLVRGDYQEKIVSALARAVDVYCDQLAQRGHKP